MEINRNNYEIFFIDYFDGKLSGCQVSMLMQFISENPDIEEEFKNFEEVTLPVPDILFEGKNKLKSIPGLPIQISDDNFSDLCIAYTEGDLNIAEKSVFEQYILKNPSRHRDYRLFVKTKLKPDLNIVFENKASLKRYETGKNYKQAIMAGMAAAAVILILFFIYFIMPKSEIKQQYAVRSNKENNIRNEEAVFNNDNNILTGQKNNSRNQKNKITFIQKQNLTEEKKQVAEKKPEYKTNHSDTNTPTFKRTFDSLEMVSPVESKKISELLVARPAIKSPVIDLSRYKVKKENIKKQNTHETLFARLKNTIRKGNFSPDEKLTFLDVADAVVKGLNKITGKNMKLHRSYSSEGKLETLAFYSPGLQIYKGDKKE